MPTYRDNIHLGTKDPLIETDDLSDGIISTDKLEDLSVTTPKIADGAVTYEKLSDSVIAFIRANAGTGGSVSLLHVNNLDHVTDEDVTGEQPSVCFAVFDDTEGYFAVVALLQVFSDKTLHKVSQILTTNLLPDDNGNINASSPSDSPKIHQYCRTFDVASESFSPWRPFPEEGDYHDD